MNSDPLIEYIKRAFAALGGSGELMDIYREVDNLGYDRGGKDRKKAIRKRISEHCSDSPQYISTNDDLFCHLGDDRSGRYELRSRDKPTRDASLVTVDSKPLRTLEDDDADEIEPSSEYQPVEIDSRSVVQRQIKERRGQRRFRDALRGRYGDLCLVTGSKCLAVLEAAHICPYKGENDNDPTNGLLLRSDIHTLFDLDLLGIEPACLRISLHPKAAAEYSFLAGESLRCPTHSSPSRHALERRFRQFQDSLR